MSFANLEEGANVRPTEDLVERRPELHGHRGQVIRVEEDDQFVVKWEGLPKPYRVIKKNLEREE